MWSKSGWVSQIHFRSAGVDDGSQGGHEVVPLDGGSGVDEHRFRAVQNERVTSRGVSNRWMCAASISSYGSLGQSGGTPPRGSSFARGFERRLGGRLELSDGVAHPFPQLAGSVRRHIDDPGPDGDRLDLVGLGHPRAVVGGLEPVASDRRLFPALLGDERELAAGVGDQDPPAARPPYEPSRAATVVADESSARSRRNGTVGPLDPLAFRAPLAHARHVGDELVDALRRCGDGPVLAVVPQPPTAARVGYLTRSLS
jgi:hypothetical protein